MFTGSLSKKEKSTLSAKQRFLGHSLPISLKTISIFHKPISPLISCLTQTITRYFAPNKDSFLSLYHRAHRINHILVLSVFGALSAKFGIYSVFIPIPVDMTNCLQQLDIDLKNVTSTMMCPLRSARKYASDPLMRCDSRTV